MKRSYSSRTRKKIYIICVEGKETETQYIDFFKDNSNVCIKCFSCNGKTTPSSMLKFASKRWKNETSDERWLILDIDNNKKNDFEELLKWEKKGNNYLAFSNSSFEFWLVLHFEKPSNQLNVRECNKCLKKYLPDYEKHIYKYKNKFKKENISKAIKFAKEIERAYNAESNIFSRNGSTMYTLVEKLIDG
jgi:hypothetical protein